MKKILPLLLTLILFASCSPAPQSSDGEATLRIVTTMFPQYDFARAIAADNADITMLLPPGGESHSFEPTPKDIIAIRECDIFIYTGGESDAWVETVLSSADMSNTEIITLLDCVDAVTEEITEGMETAEPEDGEYDEHVWTSPKNVKLITERIRGALSRRDPANSALYAANAESYSAKLDGLDAEFRAVTDAAARKTLVFGDRFPFRYFADEYGLDYYAAFPGCSSETEPSAATVSFLIDKVKELKIPVIFHIELSNEKIARSIAESTGAEVLLFHSVHNITKEDFQSGKGYLEFMAANVGALRAALQN
ncbi:MAG: metal ABC transporter substrate-binding protein [Oscillospiraceae bacterium]|nr:metal ABC transporter substrate-binding protein [Oscillospiraceae bacterium]